MQLGQFAPRSGSGLPQRGQSTAPSGSGAGLGTPAMAFVRMRQNTPNSGTSVRV